MSVQSEFLVSLLLVFISGLLTEPLVRIPNGLLNGTRFETRKGRSVSAFIGVPYGQPTTGNLRFSSPVPAKPWKGIRLANKEANACAQNYYGTYLGDEDCLYLNVFTPFSEFNSFKVKGTLKNNLLPVMFYIHGGGFSQESSNLTAYSPKYLMDKDIVFVSINYRLGIFGFLSTGDSVAPGNFGLKDQILALKWVQKNIQYFGGDPNRVTIAGNSAGGSFVNLLALIDSTNGLFHQYIIQSGSMMGGGGYKDRTLFKPTLNKLAEALGCPSINSKVLIKCLRTKSARKILGKLNEGFLSPRWLPTNEVESKDAVLTDTPLNLLAQNKMKDLPSMSGNTRDEGLMYTLEFHLNWTSEPITEVLETYITQTSQYYMKSNVAKFGALIKSFYFTEPIASMDQKELLKNFTDLAGDASEYYPEIILIDKLVKTGKSPAYLYLFGYRGNTTLLEIDLDTPENVGVCHAEELLYLFPKGYSGTFTKKDEKILNLMVDLWTSFVKNGQPTSDEMDDPNMWLPYNENRSYLQIGNIDNNTDPSVILDQDLFSDRMQFWRENVPVV